MNFRLSKRVRKSTNPVYYTISDNQISSHRNNNYYFIMLYYIIIMIMIMIYYYIMIILLNYNYDYDYDLLLYYHMIGLNCIHFLLGLISRIYQLLG
jgi:hypothetical protein